MRIKLFLLFIFFSLRTFAHEDHYVFYHKENLYFQHVTGWEKSEINNKIKILIHLTEKLLAEKHIKKEKVYINFTNFTLDSAYCTVGYGDFVYENFQKDELIKGKGLKVTILDANIDIKEILSLVSSSLDNLQSVKKYQRLKVIDLHLSVNGENQYDTLVSIPSTTIMQYKLVEDKIVNRLIEKKTYSNLIGPESFWNLDYYYQNNKFHFYNTSEPETKYNPRTGNDDIIKIFGEDVLVVDDITEMTGDWNNGMFVFTNDSTFYYIPKAKTDVQGPFKLDSICFGRPPVREIKYEYFGFSRFTLYFDNFITITKALFIPEKGILINNYQVLEGNTIQSYIDSTEIPKEKKKKEYSIILMILPFLLLSIILNVWLIQRRRNKGDYLT